MASRYGRNQKRAHRLRIAEMEAALDHSVRMQRNAERRAMNAKSEALREFMEKQDYIKEAIKMMARELGRALGPHLEEPAMKLLASSREPPIRFDATFDPNKMVTVLRGEIPPLRYNIALLD